MKTGPREPFLFPYHVYIRPATTHFPLDIMHTIQSSRKPRFLVPTGIFGQGR